MKSVLLFSLLKKGLALLSLVLILIGANSSTFLYIDYQLRSQAYEAACENKAKPELECHGACQLSKTMTKQMDSHSSKQGPVGILSTNTATEYNAQFLSSIKIENAPFLLENYTFFYKTLNTSYNDSFKSNFKSRTPSIETPPPRSC